MWGITADNTIGVKENVAVSVRVKYQYDKVFSGDVGNAEVYAATTAPIVATAMDGINGTIFAYGVTSSGKTHTMMVWLFTGQTAGKLAVMASFDSTIFWARCASAQASDAVLQVLSAPGAGLLQGTDDNWGMVPRAIQHVFDAIEKTPNRKYLLRLSMMEIYNEVCSSADLDVFLSPQLNSCMTSSIFAAPKLPVLGKCLNTLMAARKFCA